MEAAAALIQAVPELRPYKGEQTFKNMFVVSTLPKSKLGAPKPLLVNETRYGIHFDHSELDYASDKFGLVEPNTRNVYKAVDSWDVYGRNDVRYNEFGNEVWMRVMHCYDATYGSLFFDSVATDEEISESIELDRSPGWPWTYLGIRTKEDLIQHKIS